MQVGSLQKFAEEYNIHVKRAIRRFEKGVPATVEMPDRDNQSSGAGVIIQVTQDILEFKDMLFLKMTDIDQVLPPSFHGERKVTCGVLLSAMMQSLMGSVGLLISSECCFHLGCTALLVSGRLVPCPQFEMVTHDMQTFSSI